MKITKWLKKYYRANFGSYILNFLSLIDQTHKSQVAWIKTTLAKDYVCLKPMEGYRDMPIDEMAKIESV